MERNAKPAIAGGSGNVCVIECELSPVITGLRNGSGFIEGFTLSPAFAG
ncbi:MAG TPA: hypothetical protein VIV66_04230 [Pyrinomonadaceae bacterium]